MSYFAVDTTHLVISLALFVQKVIKGRKFERYNNERNDNEEDAI